MTNQKIKHGTKPW